MSDELQAEIDRLKKLNESLATEAVDLRDELKTVRSEAKERRLENRTLAQQLADLTTERDTFKAQAEATPTELQGKVDELTGKLRDVTHRQAFERVAKSLKVSDPARQADLWALSGYKPDSDTPDESRLSETIQSALKGRGWMLDSTGSETPTTAPGGAQAGQTTPEPGRPGPGSDRGQSLSSGSSSAPGRIPGRL